MADTSRQDYYDRVKTLVVAHTMTYCPSRENTLHKLTFNSNGTMSGGGFTNWRMHDDHRRGKLQLRLYSGSDYAAWAWLGKDGLWEGKDMRNGPIEIRTDAVNVPDWEGMHDQRRFEDTLKSKELPPSLVYFEQPPSSVDWSEYAWNIQDAMGSVPENKTAIAIAGCNRLDYFREVVQALAQNSKIKSYPVFCFLDKPRREGELPLVKMQADFVKDQIPGTVVIERPRNFGCGRNIIDIRRQLFDNAGYERVFMFEDDCVPSSNYLILMENLLDWAEATYSNVGIVQGWSECKLDLESKQSRLNHVRSTYENWWCYLQNKASWDASKGFIYSYEDVFLNIDNYQIRPHRSIIEWMRLQAKHAVPQPQGDNPMPLSSRAKDEQDRFLMNHYSSGQDGATAVGTYLAGYQHIATSVNRARYIGKLGIHATPEFYQAKGYGDILLDEFKSDSYLKKFQLV